GAPPFEMVTTPPMPIEALERDLAALGPGDAVLLLTYSRDALGREFRDLEAASRIVQASSVPVYGVWEAMIGTGIVGGFLHSTEQLGTEIGVMVSRILDGSEADAVAIVDRPPHDWIFDFRVLTRFGIAFETLPDGARLIGEPDTFYYRYRQYFWLAVGVMAAIAFYIAQLLLSIRRRARAQRGLEQLIEAGEHPLPDDTAQHFAEGFVDRLRQVAPYLVPLGLYRRGEGGLEPVGGVVVDGASGRKKAGMAALLEEAMRARSSLYRGQEAAIVLPDPALPVSVATFRGRRRIDAIDRGLLDILTRNIAIEFANREAVRLAGSLATARAIQEAMLPRDLEALGERFGVAVAASLRPAKEVGGDLYDVFAIDEDRLCVLVGDVSDKGVPAALLMAITRTLIRATAETLTRPADLLAKVNDDLERDNRQAMFVTLLIVVFDRRDGSLAYANAGHLPPMVRDRAGQWRSLPAEVNIALGVLPGHGFTAHQHSLAPGETLFLYTDGVVEECDAAGVQFGDAGLAKTLSATERAAPPGEIIRGVTAAVARFGADGGASDDVTVLCFTRLTDGAAADSQARRVSDEIV
ncbi:MAG: SpoIIE family protein phosphatase, partial [Pseudomonadota bacterium]